MNLAGEKEGCPGGHVSAAGQEGNELRRGSSGQGNKGGY